jgi:hypothetical protein
MAEVNYPGWLPLAIASMLYIWQAWEYLARSETALGVVFIGYTLANVGLIFDFIKRVGE